MKWIGLVLAGLLFLTPAALAAEDPASTVTEIIDNGPESPCGGSETAVPGEICHINPDTGETVKIGQSTPTWWWETDEETGKKTLHLLPIGLQLFHKYNINYRPGPGYVRPDFQWVADWLKTADPKLTSQTIQNETIDFTNEQYESDRGRTCYYDDQGNLINMEVSDTVYILILKYVQNVVQYSKRFTTFWALNKMDHQNYEEPTERISKNVRPCNFKTPGIQGPEQALPKEGIVTFSLYDLPQIVWQAAEGIFIKSTAVITNSRRNPKIEEIASQGPGVIAEDMGLSPIANAEEYADEPGFIETFAVGGAAKSYRPKQVTAQVQDNPFVGSFDKNTTPTYLDNLVQCGYQYLCQTLWPAQNMPEQCKFSAELQCGEPSPIASNLMTPTSPYACMPEGASEPESENTPTSDSPSQVTEAAATAGIPNCVLDGVYAMESSRGANSSCTPNVCGAVGPFAITVGFTGSRQGGGQCSKDTACSQCPAGYCPNAIEGTGLTAADMCDTGKAAAFAARLLKGKADSFGKDLTGTDRDIAGSVDLQDAIIAGGNSYFGSNHTFTSGQNIEPGCSYGESVLKKYCGVSSYICRSRNFDVSGK